MYGFHARIHFILHGCGYPSSLPQHILASPHQLRVQALHLEIYRGTFSLSEDISYLGYLLSLLHLPLQSALHLNLIWIHLRVRLSVLFWSIRSLAQIRSVFLCSLARI